MLKSKVELTSEISADPLSVSSALVAKGLIPEALHTSILLPAKENKVKASELVSQVTNKVRTYPAKFAEFLEILQGFNWLEDVLKTLNAAYKDLATTSTEGIQFHAYVL